MGQGSSIRLGTAAASDLAASRPPHLFIFMASLNFLVLMSVDRFLVFMLPSRV